MEFKPSLAFIVALAAVSMSGCALTPEEASHMSMYGLCEKMLTSNNATTREVAFDMLDRHGDLDTCRANANNIHQSHAASTAAMSNVSNQLMNMSNQLNQQQQQPLQTFCTTSGQGQLLTHTAGNNNRIICQLR